MKVRKPINVVSKTYIAGRVFPTTNGGDVVIPCDIYEAMMAWTVEITD